MADNQFNDPAAADPAASSTPARELFPADSEASLTPPTTGAPYHQPPPAARAVPTARPTTVTGPQFQPIIRTRAQRLAELERLKEQAQAQAQAQALAAQAEESLRRKHELDRQIALIMEQETPEDQQLQEAFMPMTSIERMRRLEEDNVYLSSQLAIVKDTLEIVLKQSATQQSPVQPPPPPPRLTETTFLSA